MSRVLRRLRCDAPRDIDQTVLTPIIVWSRHDSSECPQANPFVIEFEQVCKPLDSVDRFVVQPLRAVQEVLCCVKPVTDERLWSNDQPGLTFRSQNIFPREGRSRGA